MSSKKHVKIWFLVDLQGPWNERNRIWIGRFEEEKPLRQNIARFNMTGVENFVAFEVREERVPNSRRRVKYYEGVTWNPMTEWFSGVVAENIYLEFSIYGRLRMSEDRLMFVVNEIIQKYYTREE